MNTVCKSLRNISRIFAVAVFVGTLGISNGWSLSCSFWNTCSSNLSAYYASSCSNGNYNCTEGSSARYQVTHYCDGESGYRYHYRCHRCASGSYAVFAYDSYNHDYTGTFLNCATCPDSSTWAANHIASCTNAIIYDHITDYYSGEPQFNEDYPGLSCEDGYNMILEGTTGSQYYTCKCENTGDSARNVYSDNVGACHKCSDRSYDAHSYSNSSSYYWDNDAYASCNDTDIQCAYWGYKAVRSDGDYACPPCPYVKNARDLGLSSSSGALYPKNLSDVYGSWSSTDRCTFITVTKTTNGSNNNGKCQYVEVIKPNSTCQADNTRYLTGTLPNTSTLNPYNVISGCDYEVVSTTYNWAAAGYGISGTNGTTSVTCGPCGDGYYSPAGSVNCIPLPKNSTKNSDGSGFDCVAGTYKSGSSCVGCPIESFNGPATLWGSSAAGSTSVTGCYTPGTATGNAGSDDTGDYEYTSNCYWGNVPATVSYFYWSSSANATACSSAINEYCGTYLGITNGYEFGNCAESHKTTNPLAIDTIDLHALFGYIYGSCGGNGFNVSVAQGSN